MSYIGSLGHMTPPPLPDAKDSSLTQEQRKGRTLLLIMFVGMVTIDVGLLLLKAKRQGFEGTITTTVRIALSIALMYAVWIGQRWARWLMVGLMFAASVLLLVTALARPHPLLLSMLVTFAIIGWLIGFSKDVSSFLTFQRERR